MLSIHIDGLDELMRDAADADRVLSDGIRHSVADACEEGAAEARSVHRWKNRTGQLEASIHARVEVSTPGGASGVIEAAAPYASYLEEGTPPHVIEARHAPALHWVDDSGEHHFAKRVNHPGTKPSPFMGPAYQKAERVVERDVEVAAEKAVAILNR
jgi:HK97 gp10 family phage protein